MTKNTAITPRPPRISTKLRKTIRLIVRDGLSIVEACTKAGFSPAGYHKAIKRPHVQALKEEEELALIAEIEADRGPRRARAYQHAERLMRTAKSEAVQMRAVEFLSGEKHGAAVQVNVSNTVASGYHYPRPGEKVVEIQAEAEPGEGEADQPSEVTR